MARLPLTFSEAEGHFCCLHLISSGNIACFNCSMFIHKSESTRGLWLKLYCQRWKTFQCHRQSRTLEKW